MNDKVQESELPEDCDNGVLMVYMTFADRDEAARIASALVDDKLAACVNVLGEIDSTYEWQGKVERATEVAATAKTTRAQFGALEARVAELHSYECPCIVAWPIETGHGPFLDWVKDSRG